MTFSTEQPHDSSLQEDSSPREDSSPQEDSFVATHDLGLERFSSRRRALMLLGATGLAGAAAACGSNDAVTGSSSTTASSTSARSDSTSSGSSAAASTTAAGTNAGTGAEAEPCAVIPTETAGPYPGDGSNGLNVLSEDGVVREDIRSSFGASTGAAEGVDLTVQLAIVDTGAGCAAVAHAAVYLWHANEEGKYSGYSSGVENENFLRGVAVADQAGMVRFLTAFPGCYDGRWPHIHFEVFESVESATSGGRPLVTSQLALPQAACEVVYSMADYPESAANLRRVSLDRDMVFGDDGAIRQLATMTGSNETGWTAALTVPV